MVRAKSNKPKAHTVRSKYRERVKKPCTENKGWFKKKAVEGEPGAMPAEPGPMESLPPEPAPEPAPEPKEVPPESPVAQPSAQSPAVILDMNAPKLMPESEKKWLYPTPLEVPECGLYDRVVSINGMPFQKRADMKYGCCPYKVVDRIIEVNNFSKAEREAEPHETEQNILRYLMQNHLWYLIYFVMKNPLANHPFIMAACKDVQEDTGDTLHTYARDHLKTTVITVGRTVQKLLNDPEKRVGIFSAVRPLATKVLNLIRSIFEDPFLCAVFPDVLWKEARKEAPRWTDAPDGGLILKRNGFYKEMSVSAWGLVEGMPTGDHYTDMIFDDIVTQDHQSPEIIQKVCDNFDMAENIGTRDRQLTVVGTFYRHDDPLVYIKEKKDPITGLPCFRHVKKPATVDGTFTGKSVFLPESTMAKKRTGKLYFFYCQQLLDPTPRGMEKLNRDHLVKVKKKDLPINLYKFMLVDAAGDKGRRLDRRSDAWALMVLGVEPYRDELGASRVFILDMVIEEMDLVEAQKSVVDMYCRNGRILKLGIEKVGMSSTEIHICAALRAKNRHVSVERGNLELMKPASRSKEYRIESNLAWPLKNGKVHYLETISEAYVERLKLEMEKFPAWHDDGLDALSYGYDLFKDYRFGDRPREEVEETFYDKAFRRSKEFTGVAGWQRV